MGAGIVECDVTFTKDKELVCRHAQNDLHTTTTNILATPLAAQCTTPVRGRSRTARTRRSNAARPDITLADFRTLVGKMDAGDKTATETSGATWTRPRTTAPISTRRPARTRAAR